MTGRPRPQGPPPPEGSCGPVEVKGQGPEPRGGAEPGADRGAIVNLNIIRPAGSEEDFYSKRAGRKEQELFFSFLLTPETH